MVGGGVAVSFTLRASPLIGDVIDVVSDPSAPRDGYYMFTRVTEWRMDSHGRMVRENQTLVAKRQACRELCQAVFGWIP